MIKKDEKILAVGGRVLNFVSLSNDFKIAKKNVEENLTKLGYNIYSKILDTCEITDIPHHRERIYIVGFLDHKSFDQPFFYHRLKIHHHFIASFKFLFENRYRPRECPSRNH